MTPPPTDPEHGKIDAAFAALARFSVRFRWGMVVVWVAATALLPGLLPSLASQTKSQNGDFLPAQTPSIRASNLAVPFEAKNVAASLLVFARPDRPLGPADQAAVDRVEAGLGRAADVLDVRDQGLSRDGRARRALVELRDRGGGMANLDPLFTRLRAAVHGVPVPAGLAVHFAGQFAQAADAEKQQTNAQGLTQQLSILFIVGLLLVVFRAALAPLITLLPAALSLVVAGPLIGEAAKAGLAVSPLTQILLTVIVLGAGTDYGLFLIYRVREELSRGVEPRLAVTNALARVGETITFSAACVVAALLSVLLARFGLYRGLGPGLAIGVVVVLVAGLTLLPALLAIFGRASFWPSRPQPGREYRGVWGRVGARVVGRPRRTLTIGVIVFGALALALLAYKPAGFGAPAPVSGSDSAAGGAVLAAHFPRTVSNPTNVLFKLGTPVWADPTPLGAAARGLSAASAFTGQTGPLDPNGQRLTEQQLVGLHARLGPPQGLARLAPGRTGAIAPAVLAAYRATAQFVSPDGLTLQYYVTLRAGDPSSTAALDAVPAVRRAVDAVAASIGAVDHGVAGEAPIAYDVSHIATSDLLRIVPLVLVIIALLLAVLLRSLVAPLYLIVSVGLSYLASLGLAIIVFVLLGGDSGLNFVLPFFMFIFLMALGSDYNILVMTRIREEARSAPLGEAVRRAIAATGGTVTSAGLVLAGTFAVLTVAGNSQTREIGLGIAAGIMLDTFLVRTLLIPSVVVLLGRMNWWPSRLGEAPSSPDAY